MEWRGTGILLTLRPHGETSVIVDVLTPERGRYTGVIRGGSSRKMAPILQPGAQLDLTWRARLESHMGAFITELERSRTVHAMGSRLALAGLNSVVSLLSFSLPEREPYPALYTKTEQLLDLLGQDDVWPLAYLRWEMTLLEELGFGLDLRACAVTGEKDDLRYVSPKTGRAVSQSGAGDWVDRLLPLPQVMLGHGVAPDSQIRDGLRTTGYFLERHLAAQLGAKPLPDARARLVSAFSRRA